MAFSFQVTKQGRIATVSVRGELDIDTAPGLGEALNQLIDRDGVQQINIALGDVSFIDSSGLQTVLKASSRLDDGSLVVASASEPVRRLFEVAGVDRLLKRI